MTAAIQEERRAPATSDAAPVAAHADVAPADAAPAHAAAAPRWVMLARTGRWLGHPAAPEVITPEGLRSAADYFARHYAANGTDVVVDYHHASVASPA